MKSIPTMTYHLFVFGNIGHLDQLPKSGGQSSARRVMKGFQDEGIVITPIRRHRAEIASKLGHRLEVGYFALHDLIKMIGKMIFGRRKGSAFMQMTYAGALVPYEYILATTARLLGYKNMLYLQGGLVMDTYPRGDKIHKWLFKHTMDKQSLILFEGYDALLLTQEVSDSHLLYFPSYVVDEVIPEKAPSKPEDELNLCYFGRMSPVKNPIITLQVFELLCERHPDKNINLTLVGSDVIHSDYVAELDRLISQSPYKNHITRKENSPFEYLIQMMQRQHFYIFPTCEKAEGHSNALNEAMSQGLIPIASDYHFNKTIIGDERLVVKGYEPADYADCIDHLIKEGCIPGLSEKMWRRVKENYSFSKVNDNTCKEVKDAIYVEK